MSGSYVMSMPWYLSYNYPSRYIYITVNPNFTEKTTYVGSPLSCITGIEMADLLLVLQKKLRASDCWGWCSLWPCQTWPCWYLCAYLLYLAGGLLLLGKKVNRNPVLLLLLTVTLDVPTQLDLTSPTPTHHTNTQRWKASKWERRK